MAIKGLNLAIKGSNLAIKSLQINRLRNRCFPLEKGPKHKNEGKNAFDRKTATLRVKLL